MAINTLAFGNADPVTQNPIIDGFIDHDFMNTSEPGEVGYANGGRQTWSAATLSPVILQGVRTEVPDRLVIGILARFDSSFDDNDTIVVALRPSASNPDLSLARLIAINPVSNGIGAAVGAGAGPNEIKTGQQPRDWDLWRGTGQTSPRWTQVVSNLPFIDIKVRSWRPQRMGQPSTECAWSIEIGMPREAGGNPNWITLQDSFAIYCSIIRLNPIIGANQLVFPPGAPGLNNIPGATLNLAASSYGVGLIPALQTPPYSNLGLGVRFPNGALSVGARPYGSQQQPGQVIRGLHSSDQTDNEMVAILHNPHPTDTAAKVTAEFRFKNFGLSSNSNNIHPWDRPFNFSPNPSPAVDIPPASTVTIGVRWSCADVSASYGQDTHQCMHVQLDSSGGANFSQASIRTNMEFVNLSAINRPVQIDTKGLGKPGGRLRSHRIVMFSYWRELVIKDFLRASIKPGLVDEETSALLTGAISVGEPWLFKEFDLQPGDLFNPELDPSKRKNIINVLSESRVYLWITEGWRSTGKNVTIRRTKYPLWGAELGSFGVAAYHKLESPDDRFGWSFEGDGLTQIAPGVIGIDIAAGDAAEIGLRLGAGKEVAPGDHSELPRDKLWDAYEKWTREGGQR